MLGFGCLMILQDFRPFNPDLMLISLYFNPLGHPCDAMPMEQEKSREFQVQQAPRAATGGYHTRGGNITTCLFIFSHRVAEVDCGSP